MGDEIKRGQGGLLSYFAGHPKGFWFFFWGEFAERCSYYGMRAILAKYMADQLGLGEANASTYMSFFIAACYFLPLLGGWVADKFFGKYWTIVGFSIPYILGHVILGVETFTFLVIALTLLAMGSGVIKPNISTLMGLTYDQQRPGQTMLRSDAFAIFYFAINLGAALSQFAMPPIRTHNGYAIAFMFPAVLMVVAFAIFAAGKRYYAVETITRREKTAKEWAEQIRVLRRILGLFTLVVFFWAIFDQSASTWIFFADACMDLHMFGIRVDPDQIQAFNPVFIMILVPPITLAWRLLDRKGIRVRPTDKMLVGFVLTAITMGVMAFAALRGGAAELRPSAAEGTLRIEVPGDPKVSFEGDLKIAIQNPKQAVIEGKNIQLVKDGQKTPIDGKLELVGDYVALMPIQRDPETNEITKLGLGGEGLTLRWADRTKVERTIVEKPLDMVAVPVEGTMKINERWFVHPRNQTSVWWQVFAYLIITVAEVLISVTGLELAYAAAPKHLTGFVTACWLLTVGIANLVINAPVTRLYTKMQPFLYFGMLAVVMLVVAGAFVVVARRFNSTGQESPAS